MIGGSAGLAWRAAGHTVVGYARRPQTRRLALELGAADETPDSLAEAAQAEVIVLAPPVLAIRQLLAELAPHIPGGAVVTDVASTKRCVEQWARRALPATVHFVGGHPMAGKETAGIEHADGSLFRHRTWAIVPPPAADPAAVELVTRLARDTGARTVQMDAAGHDAAVAATSHLPFAVSALLCQSVIAQERFADLAPMAGTGLRDLTRLASGDALMHRDIALTNRDNLVRELERFAVQLAAMAALLRRLPDPDEAGAAAAAGMATNGDEALTELEAQFERLKLARDGWLSGQA